MKKEFCDNCGAEVAWEDSAAHFTNEAKRGIGFYVRTTYNGNPLYQDDGAVQICRDCIASAIADWYAKLRAPTQPESV